MTAFVPWVFHLRGQSVTMHLVDMRNCFVMPTVYIIFTLRQPIKPPQNDAEKTGPYTACINQ